ncbi:aminoacyl tRNA synthase complex-interacting multifunctional protein 1 [Iris pallida]|uniref:Aminoacyl tRNA synthase complex-interacting multifunctional protein 1 n=1 Tax=Iris pallida TaxID=29817 RepID=A0AAX6ER10_IRIPA|nr:aminoacyl tRNA synthase complex-interacting multifunctional protein 1 [Iris pallida]KAJ6826873.1 aminoacyl tRNA synthase complex-interacting multifunctional protein 1 [Iris pallida]
MAPAAAAPDTKSRNKAIVAALCNRFSDFSIDPKSFENESIGESDITSLFDNILRQSPNEHPLKNQDEVMKWVQFANTFPSEVGLCNAALKDLNEDLAQKSVLLGEGFQPSEADIVVFSAVHSFVSQLSEEDMQKFKNVIRWIDYIQNVEDFGGTLAKIVIKKPQFEQLKKVSADGRAAAESKKSSKGKEEKKPSEKESSEKDTEISVTILNIQVGLIRKASKHPSADSLLVEEIDIGDGNLRQVVSGLAKYYSPDELTNRRVVLITNVKPGKLRDVLSSGLVLCASNEDHTVVEPLIPPEGASIGERVIFAGHEGKPDDVLNPKKKQLEKITPHLYTDDKGIATYKGIPFMTSAGPCTSKISRASIK